MGEKNMKIIFPWILLLSVVMSIGISFDIKTLTFFTNGAIFSISFIVFILNEAKEGLL